MFRRILLAGFVVSALSVSKAQAQLTVFSTDFNSGLPSAFSGAGGVEGVQGFSGLGIGSNTFSGDFLRNDSMGNPASPSILTLTSLPAHTTVSMDFLLAAIDSWDSIDGAPAPDFFNITVDGNPVFQATFVIAGGSVNYNGTDIGGGQQQRGFNGGWNDRAYDMSFEPSLQNIPHSASSLTIAFFAGGAGWQGGIDESWGIDNVRVSLNAVPEPGTIALLTGLAVSGVGLRRRRKA